MRMGPNQLEFLLYVEGIFGSDGCVDMERMPIYQSNESFINALALAIKWMCASLTMCLQSDIVLRVMPKQQTMV